MGSFIFACPVKFLHGEGIGEMSLGNLISVLEKAVEPDTTCGNIQYAAEVIIPMTFRYLCCNNLSNVITMLLTVVTFANGGNHLSLVSEFTLDNKMLFESINLICSSCSDSVGSKDGEISVGDIRHTVQLTLSIMKYSLTNSNVTWMYNASGEWLF